MFSGDMDGNEIMAESGKALLYFTSDTAVSTLGFNISFAYGKCVKDCYGHGKCIKGECKCDEGFNGKYCEHQKCSVSLEGKQGPCNEGKCVNGKCHCSLQHGRKCQVSPNLYYFILIVFRHIRKLQSGIM